MRDTFKYLSKLEERGAKPNVEQNLAGRFTRTHEGAQAVLEKKQVKVKTATVLSMFPKGGIQDNTVNRLLLMSNSEHHLPNVPMAFFIRPPVTNAVRAAPDKPIRLGEVAVASALLEITNSSKARPRSPPDPPRCT